MQVVRSQRLILVAVLGVAIVLGGLRLAGAQHGDAGLDPVFHYRFQRTTRGAVIKALEQEMVFYQQRMARDPRPGLDLAALASTYLKMARATGDLSWYLLAEQDARRSLVNLPFHNTGALLVLARVAEARHAFAEALRLAAQAGEGEESLAVRVTAYLAMGEVDRAWAAADRLVHLSPTLGAYTLHGLVNVALGRDDAAVTDFRAGIAAEETGEPGASVLARVWLGRLHYRRGRLAQAEALYREALRILPQHPLALIQQAELETRLARYQDAERHLHQVVTISRESPTIFDHAVLRGLARLRLLQGDAAGAEPLWAEAETRLRRDVTAGTFGHRRELARLLLERGRPGDVPEALALMQREVQLRHDAETLDVFAWALSRSGRWREAGEVMARALQWGIRDAGMLYRTGTIEAALGHPDAAQRFFQRSREVDPTFEATGRRTAGLGMGSTP